MAMSPKEAAAALAAYRAAAPVAIMRGMRRGLRKAEALAKTRYMERMDNRGPKFQKPNAPPGPLGIRQGNLARTVKLADIRIEPRAIIGGLQAGDSKVRYARIHELGGRAGRGLASRIDARPYLTPALNDPDVQLVAEVKRELQKLAVATLRGLARPA
jgi:phage gpG-like protein